jgi:hypothetical protein
MVLSASASPFAGSEGKAVTGRVIGERLAAEAETSVCLHVTPIAGVCVGVGGRDFWVFRVFRVLWTLQTLLNTKHICPASGGDEGYKDLRKGESPPQKNSHPEAREPVQAGDLKVQCAALAPAAAGGP